MARQQLATLHNELGKTYGLQHQLAPVTPVRVPKEQSDQNLYTPSQLSLWAREEVQNALAPLRGRRRGAPTESEKH